MSVNVTVVIRGSKNGRPEGRSYNLWCEPTAPLTALIDEIDTDLDAGWIVKRIHFNA